MAQFPTCKTIYRKNQHKLDQCKGPKIIAFSESSAQWSRSVWGEENEPWELLTEEVSAQKRRAFFFLSAVIPPKGNWNSWQAVQWYSYCQSSSSLKAHQTSPQYNMDLVFVLEIHWFHQRVDVCGKKLMLWKSVWHANKHYSPGILTSTNAKVWKNLRVLAILL